MLVKFKVERGDSWDIFHDGSTLSDSDWIVQHPPTKYLGKSSGMLPVAEVCDSGDDCNTEFQLKSCVSDKDCKRKKFCPVKEDTG